jgi:signal transduction histidine kinase
MANAAKHADATTIRLTLRAVAGGAALEVIDDGRGFDPAARTAPSGVGLRLMRERVAELGGEVTVDSRPGIGTTVRAVLQAPIEARESAAAGTVL